MKIRIKPEYFLNAIVICGIVLVAACAHKAKGNKQSVKTGTTMEAVEGDYKQAIEQLDITKASLEELVRPGQSDVKKAYEQYAENVDKMEKLGKRLSEHSDNMRVQSKDYFEEWRKQGDTYTNPEIQALSEQRRSDLSAIFDEISNASIGVKGAFKAYMSDITEIRTYLSTDLTPKGVESITPTAEKANADGDRLKLAIEPVLISIGKARAEFAQGGAM